MKFSHVTFRRETEIRGFDRFRPNSFSLSAERGARLELDPTGAGIIVSHPDRPGSVWVSVNDVAYAEIEPEADEATEPVKRGPGRPPKAA